MGAQLEETRRNVLLGQTEITLYGVTYPIARTPAGKGLASYMRLINRRRLTIWNKLKDVPEDPQKAVNHLKASIDAEAQKGSYSDEAALESLREKLKKLEDSLPSRMAEVEQIISDNDTTIQDAMLENQEEDAADITEAFYFSAWRVNPLVERGAIVAAIDDTNMNDIFSKLVEINKRDEKPPKAGAPTMTGQTTTETKTSTPTTGETD